MREPLAWVVLGAQPRRVTPNRDMGGSGGANGEPMLPCCRNAAEAPAHSHGPHDGCGGLGQAIPPLPRTQQSTIPNRARELPPCGPSGIELVGGGKTAECAYDSRDIHAAMVVGACPAVRSSAMSVHNSVARAKCRRSRLMEPEAPRDCTGASRDHLHLAGQSRAEHGRAGASRGAAGARQRRVR